MKIEIMFDDLKADVQKEVLKLYGINDPKEMNLDIIPLIVLENN